MPMMTSDANIVISLRDGSVDEVFARGDNFGTALIIDWDSLGGTSRSLSVNCAGTLRDFDFDTRQILPARLELNLPVVAAMAEIDRHIIELEQPEPGLNFDAAETSTVLAALRHFQKLALADAAAASDTYADIFEDAEMLSVEAIDELCIKISLGMDFSAEDGSYGDEDDDEDDDDYVDDDRSRSL